MGLLTSPSRCRAKRYRGAWDQSPHGRLESNDLSNLENICAGHVENLYHAVNHVAFQVDDLSAVLVRLLEGGRAPFQMDFEGKERPVTDPKDTLGFGIGTLFVNDDDGNLLEFLQEGRGLFYARNAP